MSEEKEYCGLDFRTYLKEAHTTSKYPYGQIEGSELYPAKWIYPALGLAEEAGEVAGKFAKAVRDCSGMIDSERKEAIKKELGDVLWFVAELCTVMEVDMSEVAAINLQKLASRQARGVINGSGDDR